MSHGNQSVEGGRAGAGSRARSWRSQELCGSDLAKLLDDVFDLNDHVGSGLEELSGPGHGAAGDEGAHQEETPAEPEGLERLVEGPARGGGRDDHRGAGDERHRAVSPGKASRPRRSAGRKLGHHQVAACDPVLEPGVLGGVGAVEHGAENREGPAAGGDRRAVGRSVDPPGEAGHDDDALGDELAGEPASATEPSC